MISMELKIVTQSHYSFCQAGDVFQNACGDRATVSDILSDGIYELLIKRVDGSMSEVKWMLGQLGAFMMREPEPAEVAPITVDDLPHKDWVSPRDHFTWELWENEAHMYQSLAFDHPEASFSCDRYAKYADVAYQQAKTKRDSKPYINVMGVQSDIPHALAVIRETVKPSPTPKQVRQPKDNTFKAGEAARLDTPAQTQLALWGIESNLPKPIRKGERNDYQNAK